MGESRGGEGRAEGPTVIQVFTSMLQQDLDDQRGVERVEVQRVTEGCYSWKVWYRGEAEADEITYFDLGEADDG